MKNHHPSTVQTLLAVLIAVLLASTLTACQPPAASPSPTQTPAAPTATTPPVSVIPPELPDDGGLEVYAEDTAWENWSWNTTVDLYSTTTMHLGTQSVEIIFMQPSAGFSLRSAKPVESADYQTLSFWIYAPDGERHIFVFTQSADDNSESAKVSITVTSQWQEVKIPLADMGGEAPIKRISIQDDAEGREDQPYPLKPIYLDDLRLVP